MSCQPYSSSRTDRWQAVLLAINAISKYNMLMFIMHSLYRSVVYSTVHVTIGVDLAGIQRGTHGGRRRWVGAEWGGVW